MQKTNFSFEVIIGEDGSDDETAEICEKFRSDHPDKIRLYHRSRKDVIFVNGNPTGRFNMIENLKAARGKYIAILEGDDYWSDETKLQRQFDILENNHEVVCCHHWQKIVVYEKNEWIEREAPKSGHGYHNEVIGTVDDIFANRLRVKSRTMMFRNLISNEFFPEWFYKVQFGDVPLSFLLGQHGVFYFLNEPMAVYRITRAGASTAGITELGIRRFRIQHFKSWITIWDYANAHFAYIYNKPALRTICEFYNIICSHLKFRSTDIIQLISFTFFKRRTKFVNKINGLVCISFIVWKRAFKKGSSK